MAETAQLNRRGRNQAVKVQVEVPRQFLAFELGGEAFAMDIRSVREVIQYGAITAVPLMPGFIRGVINLRGAVVPVVDLSVRFGKAPTDISRRTCIVILEVEFEGEEVVLGVIVDTVKAVLDIVSADIEPAPAFGSSLRSEFLAGVAKVGGGFVILLDVNQTLSIDEMAALTAGSPPREELT
jgi:purine-binding chemotaxis protein CheW